MRMHRTLGFVLAAAGCFATSPAIAGGGVQSLGHLGHRKPIEITAYGGNAAVGIDDLNAAGPSPGDIRTLSLDLAAEDGSALGEVHVVQTLTRQRDGVGTALKQIAIKLPKGEITATGTTTFEDITSPTARPDDTTEQLAVVGGTGEYVGASGEVDITVLPEFRSKWVIRIAGR